MKPAGQDFRLRPSLRLGSRQDCRRRSSLRQRHRTFCVYGNGLHSGSPGPPGFELIIGSAVLDFLGLDPKNVSYIFSRVATSGRDPPSPKRAFGTNMEKEHLFPLSRNVVTRATASKFYRSLVLTLQVCRDRRRLSRRTWTARRLPTRPLSGSPCGQAR